MLVKNVVRGNSVTFRTSFFDINDQMVIPVSPTLSVYYRSNNQYVTTTSNLAFSNSIQQWTGTWDSSNADVGIVEWHISGGSGTLIAEDGEFRVLSNKANGGAGAT